MHLGDDDDVDGLLAFLRAQPPEKIAAPLVGKSAFNRNQRGLEFCPVLDGDFLPAPLSTLRKKATKVCSIIGTTEFEALLFSKF